MAPSNNKRKRGGERTYSHDGNDGPQRPSPHRPGELRLAQHDGPGSNHQQGSRSPTNRGGRRGGRGTRGSHGQFSNRGSSPQKDREPSSNNAPSAQLAQQSQSSSPPASTATLPVPANASNQERNRVAAASDQAKPASQPAQTHAPQQPSTPYEFQILTDDRIQSWEKEGRGAVISEVTNALEQEEYVQLSSAFQEFVRAGLDGKLNSDEVGRLVSEILAPLDVDTRLECSSIFLDTLAVLMDSDAANPRIRNIVTATGIPSSLMREQLDEPMLQAIGLVRSTFAKVFIRQQTNILYRQSNYNLLREESEGYSKLVTELFTTTNNIPPSEEVAKETFENVKALIGGFDLDVGRVLDVTLDVFATLLVKHYRFFVKFLRISSWWPHQPSIDFVEVKGQGFGGLPQWAKPGHSGWMTTDEDSAKISQLKEDRDRQFWERAREIGLDAFFELGSRKVLSDQAVIGHLDAVAQSEDELMKETYNWIKATRTMPPSGNPVAAQLLGFKLRFYASEARDASDALPLNLIYLAALLIKIGFISLRDLYPHLYPLDDRMDAVKETQFKEKEKLELAKRPGGGALSALARAGALPDDTLPTAVSRLREAETRAGTPSSRLEAGSRAATPAASSEDQQKKEAKENLPEPEDQKINLLRSLLCMGAIPEALYMLGRFPWIPDAFPDIPKHIHRILHHSLHKVHDALCPLKQRESIKQPQHPPAMDQSGVPRGELRLEAPIYRILRWAKLDELNGADGTEYRFYWDDWADNVPVCQDVDDVFTLCNTFLNVSGVKIGEDPALISKLARIGKHSLTEDSSDGNRSRWIDLCKRLLCPALSLTHANPGVVNEVFDVLKFFSTSVRYSIYAEWFTGQISRIPVVQSAFNLTRLHTKDALKRVSKTNGKEMARALAKIACASPGVVFAVCVNQIESYPNMSALVVECGRYFTYLGYDVLNWVLLNSLGKAGRDRIADDGFSPSNWFVFLSGFVGKIFKRFAVMNMTPILQYTLDQLGQNNFMDLRILREIVDNVAGIPPITGLNENQTYAMAGGDKLKTQILQEVGDKRNENKASAKRLVKTLVENGLAGPFLVSLAKQQQTCLYSTNQLSPKIMGENFDDITAVLVQYLDLLGTILAAEDFSANVPGVVSLIADYALEPSIAFLIHRKCLAHETEEHDKAHPERTRQLMLLGGDKSSVGEEVDSVKAVEAGKPTGAENSNQMEFQPDSGEAPDQLDLTTMNGVVDSSITNLGDDQPLELSNAPEATSGGELWHPMLQNLIQNIRTVLPHDFEESMSIPFYVTFWQLTLHDIYASTSIYNEVFAKQDAKLSAIKGDRSDLTAAGLRKKDQDRKTIEEFKDAMRQEMKTHITTYSNTKKRLLYERKHWFKDFQDKWATLNAALMQHCFLPRLLMSPVDSVYTFKMIMNMHSMGTVGFRTMHIFDYLFQEKFIANVIFQCTSHEAENLGQFLKEVFKELSSWHADRATFEKQVWGANKSLPGFSKKEDKPDELLEFEDFRRLYFKWHKQLHEALRSLLSSDEYIHNRNAMKILHATKRLFPAVNFHGENIYHLVNSLVPEHMPTPKEPWTDNQLLACSLRSEMYKYKKSWVLPQAFRINDAVARNQRSSSRAPAKSKSPQPDTQIPKALTADTTTSIPAADAMVTGDRKLPPATKPEVEDGEVEDVEMRDAEKPSISQGLAKNGTTSSSTELESKGNVSSAGQEAGAPPSQDRSRAATPKPPAQLGPVKSTQDAQPGDSKTSTNTTATQQPFDQPARSEPAKDDSAGSSTSRLPHALPTRPDVPAFRRPDRQYGRTSAQGPERPDSRTRSRPDPRPENVQDTTQSKSDERQRGAPIRPTGPPANERVNVVPESTREAFKPADAQSHRPPAESAVRTTRSSSYRDGSEALQRPNSSASGPAPVHRQDARPYREYPSSSHASGSTFLQSESDPRGSERPRWMETNGGPYNAPPGYPHEQPHPHDARRAPYSRYGPGERGDSRPNPPYSTHNDSTRDVRAEGAGRPPPFDSRQHPRDYPADNTPIGPRSSRSTRMASTRDPSTSEAVPPASSRPTMEQRTERYPQEFSRASRHQDTNYGRLNSDSGPPPAAQAPPQSATMANAPPAADRRPATRDQSKQASSASSEVPAGPNPGRAGGRAERPPSRAGNTASAPATPASDDAGATISGVHPDRLRQIEGPARPPPIQTTATTASSSAPSASQAATLSVAPPSGPRSATQRPPTTSSSALPSPGGKRPPVGPAGASDRIRQDRRFANIQDTLQQNAQPPQGQGSLDRNEDRGASIRGRAGAERQPPPPPSGRQDTGPVQAERPNNGSMPPLSAAPEHNGSRDYGRRGPAPAESMHAPRDGDVTRDRRERGRGQEEQDPDKTRLRSTRDQARGQDRERDREREYAGRPRREVDEGRERYARGGERDRDAAPRERDMTEAQQGIRERLRERGPHEDERERRDRGPPRDDGFQRQQLPPRRPTGPNVEGPAAGAWSGEGNGRSESRRLDGRERREPAGGARYSEGRKRGWPGDEGRPPLETKRPRRSGA